MPYSREMEPRFALILGLLLVGCEDSVPTRPEAGLPEAGVRRDADVPQDVGFVDASVRDGGGLDTGQNDRGPIESGAMDAGSEDAGVAGPIGRARHTATRLVDGRVLIAGGVQTRPGASLVVLSSAAVYDPATETFAAVGTMATPRFGHTATLLSDGRVLVAGGRQSREAIDSTEFFDPATGLFSPGPTLVQPREAHAAVALLDGRALLVGGQNRRDGALNSAEVYDPTPSAFRRVASALVRDASQPNIAPLPDGRFLVAGGHNGRSFDDAQIFDPTAERFTPTGPMIQGRVRGFSTALPDGRVLIGGGSELNVEVSSIELYDPTAGTFAPGGEVLSATREARSVHLLDANTLLIVGGLVPVETYRIATSTSSVFSGNSSFVPRAFNTATELADGRILFAGGSDAEGSTLLRADLYEPAMQGFVRTGDLPRN